MAHHGQANRAAPLQHVKSVQHAVVCGDRGGFCSNGGLNTVQLVDRAEPLPLVGLRVHPRECVHDTAPQHEHPDDASELAADHGVIRRVRRARQRVRADASHAHKFVVVNLSAAVRVHLFEHEVHLLGAQLLAQAGASGRELGLVDGAGAVLVQRREGVAQLAFQHRALAADVLCHELQELLLVDRAVTIVVRLGQHLREHFRLDAGAE